MVELLSSGVHPIFINSSYHTVIVGFENGLVSPWIK
jgi:hypothetical protein